MTDEIKQEEIVTKLGNVAASIQTNSTRMQEEGLALRNKLNNVESILEKSNAQLVNSVERLTEAIDCQTEANRRTAVWMILLTFVLAIATVIMAWATLQLSVATRTANKALRTNAPNMSQPHETESIRAGSCDL